MNENLALKPIKKNPDISEKHMKFYSQSCSALISNSTKLYISPTFITKDDIDEGKVPKEFFFKVIFDDNDDIYISGFINSSTFFDLIHVYFQIGDPKGHQIKLDPMKWTFKANKTPAAVKIPEIQKSQIISDPGWLNSSSELEIYFEIGIYYSELLVPPQRKETSSHIEKPVGLTNARNVCYMNSALQILYNIPRLREILFSFDSSKTPSKKLLISTQLLFYMMKKSKGTLSADSIYKLMDFCNKDKMQKDSTEFITIFLEEILNQLDGSPQKSQLEELFRIETEITTENSESNTKSAMTDLSNSLNLSVIYENEKKELKKEGDVKSGSAGNEASKSGSAGNETAKSGSAGNEAAKSGSAANNFRSKSGSARNNTLKRDAPLATNKPDEYIEGNPKKLYDCIKHDYSVTKDGPITRKLKFVKFPPILIINFKRYDYDSRSNSLQKLVTPIEFQESFFLDDFSKVTNDEYRLYAILCHVGTPTNGHYHSIVYDFRSRMWIRFNDNIVDFVPNQQTVNNIPIGSQTLAYSIFYVRKRELGSLFKSETIPKVMSDFLENKQKEEEELRKKEEAIKLRKQILNFNVILEDQMNSSKSICDTIPFSKTVIEANASETRIALYEKVAKAFGYKEDEMRLWSVSISGQKNIIYANKCPIRNLSECHIFLQRKKESEMPIPSGDDKFSILTIFIKYFDERLSPELRYIGSISVRQNDAISSQMVSKLLGFPQWIRYFFFLELKQFMLKRIPPSNTFKSASINEGSTIVVQIDKIESAIEMKKINSVSADIENLSVSQKEIDEVLPDLSQFPAFEGATIKSGNCQMPIIPKDEPVKIDFNGPHYNAMEIFKGFDTSKLDHFFASKKYIRKLLVYKYEESKKPDFTLDFPYSLSLEDLKKIIREKKIDEKYRNEGQIYIFQNLKKDVLPKFWYSFDEAFERDINKNLYGEIYFLYCRFAPAGPENLFLYNIQVVNEQEKVIFKKSIVDLKYLTPSKILDICSKYEDFRNNVINVSQLKCFNLSSLIDMNERVTSHDIRFCYA